jgi:hypothetical protein
MVNPPPPPARLQVRWINVQGLSWDVISGLSRRLQLHPLAVEDILHIPQRIKAGAVTAPQQLPATCRRCCCMCRRQAQLSVAQRSHQRAPARLLHV